MGTSTTAKQLAGKLEKFAGEMRDSDRALNTVGMAGKGIYLSHAAKAGVLGSKIAGKRKAIGAGYDRTRKGNGVMVFYKGPAHLVNSPTKQHFIGAKRLGTRKGFNARAARVGAMAAFGGSNRGAFGSLRQIRNGKRALLIGGDYAAYAFHPGTAGKGFHARARAECEQRLPGVAGRASITGPLKAIFG